MGRHHRASPAVAMVATLVIAVISARDIVHPDLGCHGGESCVTMQASLDLSRVSFGAHRTPFGADLKALTAPWAPAVRQKSHC